MLQRSLVVIIMLLLVGVSGVAYAQQTATLRGEVTDDSGSVITGAEITATNNATGAEVTGSTDADGAYELTLEPGVYTITAENPGFETGIADDVELIAGQSVLRNFTLELAAVAQSVVVVGSRAEPRSVTASTVPVDVIRAEDLARQGSRDLVSQLRTVIPSFNISTQPISDAGTVVRPANLRNLAPDHTLVLVNGKRRHRSAVITWLGNGIADGSQGPDLSIIPSIAIRQVEVLRDGAAAQYGSDAIAGVMNFQLKNDPSGGSLEVQTGGFFDANSGNPATCGSGIIGDIKHSCNGIGGHGRTFSVAGNVGFPLGSNGFGNLSMEYGTAAPTNRAIQRQDALDIINAGNTNLRDTAQVWGSPRNNHDFKLFANFGHLFDDRFQLYGHGNYASRKVTGGFYFRNPHTRGGVFRGSRLHPTSLLNVYNADGEITNFPNPKELDPTESDHRDAIVYDANGQVAGLPGTAGVPSLLVGDRVWANTGVAGAGGCPIIPIVDNVPDAGRSLRSRGRPELLHSPQPVSWRIHSAVRRGSDRLLAGRRSARVRQQRLHLGRERQHRHQRDRSVHFRYGQCVARFRHADIVPARRLSAEGNQSQLRRFLPPQRSRALGRRRGVEEGGVHDWRRRSAVVGDRSVCRAGLQFRFERLQRLPGRHDGGNLEP